MAENHDQSWPARANARCRSHVGQRLAGDRMQHLGQVGMHALALTGGEDDDLFMAFQPYSNSGNDEDGRWGRLRIIA